MPDCTWLCVWVCHCTCVLYVLFSLKSATVDALGTAQHVCSSFIFFDFPQFVGVNIVGFLCLFSQLVIVVVIVITLGRLCKLLMIDFDRFDLT